LIRFTRGAAGLQPWKNRQTSRICTKHLREMHGLYKTSAASFCGKERL
jgi:hypothetical protein